MSMFAEAAVCVQRVGLQYEDAEAGDAVISLSPPSLSALMIRRRPLRLASCSTLLEERVSTFLLSLCNDQESGLFRNLCWAKSWSL